METLSWIWCYPIIPIPFISECTGIPVHEPLSRQASLILVEIIQRMGIRADKDFRILDLCSGAGGPWLTLGSELARWFLRVQISLSDLYPQANQWNPESKFHSQADVGPVTYIPTPVDATRAKFPADLRTMFLSFHHMSPETAKAIISDSVQNQQTIVIFELQERSFSFLAFFTFIAWAAPIILLIKRPWLGLKDSNALARWIFTFLIPLIPVVITVDGFLSILRTYSDDEIRNMVEQIPQSDQYVWEFRTRWVGPLPIRCFAGLPRSKINTLK